MDSIKRALKGIFKRGGKKDKQEQQGRLSKTPAAAQQQRAPAAPPKDTPHSKIVSDQPPRLPNPVSKDVPPTHPLATGKHEKPQEAVPIDHSGKAGAASEPTVGGGPTSGEQARKAAGTSAQPGTVESKDSKQVSPVTADEAPAPPSKEDGAADAIVAAPEAAAAAAPAVTESGPPHIQSTGEPEATPTKEIVNEGAHGQPNGTSAAHAPASTAAPIDTKPLADHHDDKIAVLDEPPPIKTVRAAPGMSATSGPLEDFPEGGHYQE